MSQIANRKLSRATAIGGLSVNLNHLKIDDTHYLLKAVQGHTLKEDYHVNRVVNTYTQSWSTNHISKN